jgi:hypothetical protein
VAVVCKKKIAEPRGLQDIIDVKRWRDALIPVGVFADRPVVRDQGSSPFHRLVRIPRPDGASGKETDGNASVHGQANALSIETNAVAGHEAERLELSRAEGGG